MHALEAQPLPSTNVLINDVESNGQSELYSFEAGPGEVKVNVEASTNFESSTMNVIVRDDEEAELLNMRVPVNTSKHKETGTLRLAKKQKLTLKLMYALNVGVHVRYVVDLAGAIAGGAPRSVASRPVVSQPVVVTPPTPAEVADTPKALTPIEDKWALIVGISDFANASLNLKYSAKDATDFSEFLIKEAHFAPDHVKLLVNQAATKERVLAEIGDKWLPRVAHPNDLVVIFISTHGSPSQMDLEGLNYLVMYNTDPNSLYATGLPVQDLATAIRQRVHSQRVMLIIDACHSGAANPAKGIVRTPGNVDSEALLQGTGQLVICSSEPQQVSWESKRYPNGVFTHSLIESLRKAPNLSAAFAQMKESVQSEVLSDRKELQTPVLKTKWQGTDLILSAPPSRPRTAPVEQP